MTVGNSMPAAERVAALKRELCPHNETRLPMIVCDRCIVAAIEVAERAFRLEVESFSKKLQQAVSERDALARQVQELEARPVEVRHVRIDKCCVAACEQDAIAKIFAVVPEGLRAVGIEIGACKRHFDAAEAGRLGDLLEVEKS